MGDETFYLNRCLELAAKAAGKGEAAVGSIVVLDGVIIGEGIEQSRERKDVTRHAEVVAVLDAVRKHGSCAGATLYSNVEPCILCSYVIRHHQIAKVVFSKHSGELGGTRTPFNILTTAELKIWTAPPLITIVE